MDIKSIVTNPSMILSNVSYKSLPILDDDGKSINLTDSFDFKYIKDKKMLIIYYTRRASATPAQLFEIEITYTIYWEVTCTDDIGDDMHNMKDKERNYLCYTAPAETSLLIANLCKAGCMPPLITPNEFLSE